MKKIKTVYLVIGGGPVGIQATRILRANRPESSVTVIRPEEFSVIYCAIPYVIEGVIEHQALAKKDELITETGATLIRSRVKSVDFDGHLVTLENGQVIEYSKLLIATGAVPFLPPVPGRDLPGIYTVKTAADTEKIQKAANSAKKVVVIGAGAIGIEQAQAMKSLGLEVHLVDMAGHPLSAMLDEDFGKIVLEELTHHGIIWHGNAGLSEFRGEKAVKEVVLANGKIIELKENHDFSIVSVGVKPDLTIFSNSRLEISNDGINVSSSMQTSIDGVYAAGDCVHYWSGIDGRPLGGKLATNAVPMAKVAARSMLGKKAEYQGFFNGAATCAGELRIGGTGFTETLAKARGFKTVVGLGQTTSRFPIMPGARKVQVKLVADAETGRILGGQVIGHEAVAERIDLISLALQNGLDLKKLAQFSYSAQPWQTFYPANNAIVMAAENALAKLSQSD
ncbi:MAG: FAD-dependent oxidoreductase [Candidatus Riflebacteria bacterium]